MKLVVSDIDGTMIYSPSQKLPSERLISAIKSVKSHTFVTCATGRALSWAMPVLKTAGFTAPCIIGGGTLILSCDTFEVLLEKKLPTKQLESIKSILRSYPDSRVLFNDYTEDEYLNGGWELGRLMDSESCYIMEVIGLSHELADELMSKFKKLVGVTSVKMNSLLPGTVDIHVIHEGASKEHAIEWVQNYLGISKQDTTGIGDGYNDFHIFEAVGTKLAVSNANQELKDVADKVIGSVEEDAVAKYLESL